ncbi:hypothetical protein [Chryseobacterium flavum]|uniref:hypothetical protein n=1 Tax=Chryseobacterium flavum TaxID=415851 RepID=UPI002FDAF211
MKKVIGAIAVIATNIYFGQSTSVQIQNIPSIGGQTAGKLPNIIPPSQETFNLSKVNFNASDTGEFNYQYPFAEISGIPVKLSYNSGIKVDDIGGSVGMSWQLNAGGAISRVVRDEPDEKAVSSWFPETINETQDLEMIKAAAHPDNSIDTEYDWFNFSVSNGFSGSFYIDRNLNVYNYDSENSKIEIIDKNIAIPGYGKTLEFIITDKQGNKYFFGGSVNFIEKTEFEKDGPDQMAITGWYLSKILFPDNKSVNFEYDIQNLDYLASYNTNITLTQQCFGGGLTYDFSGPNVSTMTMKSARPVLKSIEDDKTKINLLYEKLRQDVYVSINPPKLLTKVSIYNKSGTVSIKEYVLQYNEYQNSHVSSNQNMSPNNDLTTTYRYFLKNIQEIKSNQNYQFEYIYPNEFPPRFSLKKDLYGYYNGKMNYSAFPKVTLQNSVGELYILANQYFSGIATADKSIDPTYSVRGNLQKIKYPTGGYTEIGYSPNIATFHTQEVVYEQQHVELFAKRENCIGTRDGESTKFSFVSNGEPISYSAGIPLIDFEACNSEPDPLHDQHTIRIKNLTTGEIISDTESADKILRTYRQGIDTNPPYCLNYTAGTKPYCPIPTTAGHTYEITYIVTSALSKMEGQIYISYNGVYKTVTVAKQQNFPGNPVESVTDVNNLNEKYTKKYYYTTLDNINTGNIIINDVASKASYEKIEFMQDCGSSYIPSPATMYRFNNDILSVNFQNRQNRVYYPIITEIIEGKQATVKSYTSSSDLPPNHIKLPPIVGLPRNNFGDVRRSLLKSITDYKFTGTSFERIRTAGYNYSYNTKELNNYVFRQNYALPSGPVGQTDPIRNISYSEYYNYYGFSRLDNNTVEEFINNIPVKTTTEYFYNSPFHHQLTSSKIQLPDNTIQETTYSYAHEKGNQLMIEKNMIGIPLETVSTQTIGSAVKTLSKTSTTYPVSQTEANTKTSGLVLPTSVLSYDLQNLSTARTEVSYDKYDAKGNILQYTTKDGVPVAIVWGYNNTQPIAKVEGATYDQLVSLGVVTAIVDASNADALNPAQEGALITALDTFRKNTGLSGYQISTYTYNPLIGVTSITPPSGIRESYIYDTANRLEKVVDVNGNVLKEMKYNYKN